MAGFCTRHRGQTFPGCMGSAQKLIVRALACIALEITQAQEKRTMSKSKYSRTKAAGLLCGMSRIKDYKFARTSADVAQVENRQMRRLRKKK